MSVILCKAGLVIAAGGATSSIRPRTLSRHNSGACMCEDVADEGSTRNSGGHESSGNQDGANLYREMADTAWGQAEWREFIRAKGQDPDTVAFQWGVTSDPHSKGYWNKLWNVRPLTAKDGDGPAWPVIQQAAPVNVTVNHLPPKPVRRMKLAMKCADHQIGFRRLPDGTLDPFHDDKAMELFIIAVRHFRPDKIQILGDFLDLTSQGRWAQEASFANTTQLAINRGHLWCAEIRAAAPDAEIVLVEGNHDKRMQNFIETNALAAFGLKRANMPDEWPSMSMPHLLRLDELNIKYIDAYPAATDWDNDTTRNIHGTKANSRGSTTAQYVSDLPHLNTWAGHTHRLEVTYKSVIGPRGKAIKSYSANPGCLCRVDGAVPGVNGAIGADGTPAQIVEDWQQGLGLAYYNETESWPFVYPIRNGVAIVEGYELSAA